jgi:hypothetical protein
LENTTPKLRVIYHSTGNAKNLASGMENPDVKKMIGMALADSTRQSYSRKFQHFLAFCSESKLDIERLPQLSDELLCNYLIYLKNSTQIDPRNFK